MSALSGQPQASPGYLAQWLELGFWSQSYNC